jgi:hypothetical protein
MQTARARWAAAYREARKQARFILHFQDRLSTLETGRRTFPRQCDHFGFGAFSFMRLSGDVLDTLWPGDIVIRRAIHRCESSWPAPRLPA